MSDHLSYPRRPLHPRQGYAWGAQAFAVKVRRLAYNSIRQYAVGPVAHDPELAIGPARYFVAGRLTRGRHRLVLENDLVFIHSLLKIEYERNGQVEQIEGDGGLGDLRSIFGRNGSLSVLRMPSDINRASGRQITWMITK